MGLFSLEKLFGMTIRESATDGSDFTNPDADYRRLFLGEDGLPHGYLTSQIRSRTLERIQELVNEAQARADEIIAKHEQALITVATAVYEHRRLADERLNDVLQSAGFTLPRPTA